MLLDLIDLSKLRRGIVYALIMAALFAVQSLFLSPLPRVGGRAMLVPAVVMAVGLLEGGPWGGFVGLAAGYFMDMGYAEQTVLFTVLFPVLGFFAGVMGKYMLRKGFVSYMVVTLCALCIITFCQMFKFLFLSDTSTWAVWRTGLIQVGWSLVWAIPIYFPCRSIASRPMGNKRKRIIHPLAADGEARPVISAWGRERIP
ncbi:MAG: hypothetical protein LJU34_04045 [Oscillospiraceae bacterium]|nr:hypothetical protein [Oscillospiraceae bacterium]